MNVSIVRLQLLGVVDLPNGKSASNRKPEHRNHKNVPKETGSKWRSLLKRAIKLRLEIMKGDVIL